MSIVTANKELIKCSLDSSTIDAFLQKDFNDLIMEAHQKGQDYYIARVHCLKNKKFKKQINYMCYDARQLCKYIYEMIISAEGRKIRIKNFFDPVTSEEIAEINFFRLRHDSNTPFRAEYVGNQTTFLESNSFRSRIFFQEDPMAALSINFDFKKKNKFSYIVNKKTLIDFLLVIMMLCVLTAVTFVGIKYGKGFIIKDEFQNIPNKLRFS